MVPIRTAIYGGTFNPIHNAHVRLLSELARRLSFDRVLLIPASVPPHKVCRDMASGEDRLSMCKEAAKEFSFNVEVSDMELLRKGKSYTSDTLLALREKYSEDEFYFLMGEDMFLTVDRWHCPEIIFREAVLCAVPRSEEGLPQMKACAEKYRKSGARCLIENVEFLDISSTQIRDLCKERKSIDHLVPLGVKQYIEEKGLYLGENNENT